MNSFDSEGEFDKYTDAHLKEIVETVRVENFMQVVVYVLFGS